MRLIVTAVLCVAVVILALLFIDGFLKSMIVPTSLELIIEAAKNPVNPDLDSTTVNAWFEIRSYLFFAKIIGAFALCGAIGAGLASAFSR